VPVPQKFLEGDAVASAGSKAGPVSQANHKVSIGERDHLNDAVHLHNTRTVNPQKAGRIQVFFKPREGFADEVGFRSDMQPGVIAQTFDPVNIHGLNEGHGIALPHSKLPYALWAFCFGAFKHETSHLFVEVLLLLQGDKASRPGKTPCESCIVYRFQKVIERFDFKSIQGVLFVGGKENDTRQLVERHALEEFKAREARHIDVEKDEIRMQIRDGSQGILSVAALSNEFHILVVTQALRHSETGQRLIIYDQHAYVQGRASFAEGEAFVNGKLNEVRNRCPSNDVVRVALFP